MVKVVHLDSKSTNVTSQMQISELTQLQCPGSNKLAKPLNETSQLKQNSSLGIDSPEIPTPEHDTFERVLFPFISS